MRRVLALHLWAVRAGVASAETPIEKVITLLQNLKAEVENEGKAEAATYNSFSCFCKDTTAAKSQAIADGQDTIDTLSATIAQSSATKDGKATELGDRQKKQEALAKDFDGTVARCKKEVAEFEAELADLAKAISSMEKAIAALQGAKPSFLQKDALKEASASLEFAEALGMLPTQAKAFLQQGVDPADPTYKFKSSGILDVLQKLNKDFAKKKSETETAFAASKASCKDLQTSLTNEMNTNGDSIGTLNADIDSLMGKMAKDRESLVGAEGSLKDDQVYLKELTERCESAAQSWDQRSVSRADELKAMTEALEILTNGREGQRSVRELDAVNQRALLQQASVSAGIPVSAGKRIPSFVQLLQGRRQAAIHKDEARDRAVHLVKEEGGKLGSPLLSALATQIAADPFAKVKQLIQQLIQRLLDESTQEATKKGFCDTELGKAKKDRDHRLAETKALTAAIAELEAKRDLLKETSTEIQEAMPELQAALTTATEQRTKEKAENLEAMTTAKEAARSVAEAIAVLKAYYSKAARAKVLLQASPVDEDTSGPGFDSAYAGKQSGAEGVLGLLEMIKSDFERTLSLTEQAEKQAQEKFVEFEQVSKSDIAAKEMTQTRNKEDLAQIQSALAQKTADLATAQGLLDAALKAIEDLKPMCMDTGMSFDERVAKREEEITALKKALCVLDTDGREDDCK